MDAEKPYAPTAAGGCRVVDELSLLFDISYTLESSLELRDVIRPVLLKMAEVLGMKRGTITILNREHGKASISEAVGMPAGQSPEDYLQACHEVIGQVMESGLAVVVQDISQ
jgi:Nif-specific regulatory protein